MGTREDFFFFFPLPSPKRGFFFNERNISSLFANGNDPEERANLTVWERKE